MAVSLADVIGSHLPLERRGNEWIGVCTLDFPSHPLTVIGNRWRCAHSCQDQHGDDALGFLRCTGLTEDEAKAQLANGQDWTPILLVPDKNDRLAQDAPEATETTQAQDAPPPLEFPPEASTERPKPRQRRLRVVGGDTIDITDPDAVPMPAELSEAGVAAHFVTLHRNKYRTVFEWSGRGGPCWMAWDGSRWLRQPNRVSAMQDAVILGNGVKQWAAARAIAPASQLKWESKKFLGAMLDLASYAPAFVSSPTIWDADSMQLGTPAGTVDLRTGKLCESDPEDHITRQTAVAPELGPHPLFDNVIDRMCAGDEGMRAYIWRALGYSITADQREEVFWFLHGKPQSGKSTLIKTIADILGNAEEGGYAATFDMELFTDQRNDKGSERLAHLHGARFAWASETEEGKHFKTALLKLATGGDKISGRFLYQEKFSFQPTHHLWIFGNERIHLKSSDAGIKRRLHMIEYPGVITDEERDNTLKDRLKAEYPAILHSLIQGCLDWQLCAGLGKPERISDAVDNYMDSEDEVSAWLDECTERKAERVPIGDAFRSFTQWAERNGAFTISAKRFSGEIEKRGFERSKSGGVRYILGLSLKLGANL